MSWLEDILSKPTSLQVYDVLDRAFNSQKGANWPASDGFSPELAVKIIEVYHDLVANKGFALPNTPDNIKKLTAQIRKTLGLETAQPGLKYAPTNIILALNKYILPTDRALYDWVFPAQLEQEDEGESVPVKITNNIKWIVLLSLTGYVLLQTGVLKKAFNNG